ncbi:MAG: hypothetical protein RL701_7254 [Pseudomonadota bacterium]
MRRDLHQRFGLRVCRSQLQMLAAVGCSLWLASCSFGDDDAAALEGEQNICLVDSDCPKTNSCQQGLCVAKAAEIPRMVALEVTPTRMPDGSQPQAVISRPFPLRGGVQPMALTMPITVPVRVRDGSKAMAAQLTFTLANKQPFAPQSVQVNTVVPGAGQTDAGNVAVLMPDTEYKVVVQPAELSQPTHSMRFTPQAGEALEIDYKAIDWQKRLYTFPDAPANQYYLRARTKGGGTLISNSVLIDDTFSITLLFDPGVAIGTPYELEFVPVGGSTVTRSDAVGCGSAGPSPTISLSSNALKQDSSLLSFSLMAFPKLPAPIDYSAQISLCKGQAFTAVLPVQVKASTLIADKTVSLTSNFEATTLSSNYQTTVMATWDPDVKAHTFCTSLVPGDYTIVISPPANLNCELFAERRLIKSVEADIPEVLQLHSPATLSGSVLSPDNVPIANASIDLLALGQTSIKLAENDRSVLPYNRSRQITSSSTGVFDLPVDLGSYDMIIKPPAQSNYAWRILYGVEVGSRGTGFGTRLYLSAPVVVSGQLSYVDNSMRDQSLGSAEVHAYTLVDEGTPTERRVEIARGQSDASGKVTLLLPAQLQKSWVP